nr:hypothetical protein [Candidatus Sigynarchaeota archaeon]
MADFMEENKIEKIKKAVKEKFQVVADIENAEYAIVIKEELVDVETSSKNYEIGIGKVMRFPQKISVNGRTYRNEELDDIKEGSVLLSIKDLTRKDARVGFMLAKIPKSFNRAVDEAAWAGKFKNLDDLLKVIEDFKKV